MGKEKRKESNKNWILLNETDSCLTTTIMCMKLNLSAHVSSDTHQHILHAGECMKSASRSGYTYQLTIQLSSVGFGWHYKHFVIISCTFVFMAVSVWMSCCVCVVALVYNIIGQNYGCVIFIVFFGFVLFVTYSDIRNGAMRLKYRQIPLLSECLLPWVFRRWYRKAVIKA